MSLKFTSKHLCFVTLVLTTFIFSVNGKTLTWQSNLPNLPAPAGDHTQHGVAGAYSGTLTITNKNGAEEKALLVAGGSNFPKKSLLTAIQEDVAAEKVYHQDIFFLTQSANDQWQQSQLSLPLGAAYGESFTTEQGILLFGGEIKQYDGSVTASSDIALISYQEGSLSYKKIGEMPVTFAKGGGAYFQGKVYIIGGIQNGAASNNVYSYDVNSSTWQKELPLLGKNRISPVVTIHGNKSTSTSQLYVFSGFSINSDENIALNDGLSLNISDKSAKWQTIAPIQTLLDKQLSLIGAAAIKVSAQQTLFLGGYNKSTWDNWLSTYQKVKGTKQEKAEKLRFFSQAPSSFKWNRDALLFDSSNQSWTNLGETPFLPNCGAAIEHWQNNIVLINGEIKPGVRTNTVKVAHFNNKK
ncbi:kelch repeat-containing protein [Thalassotalea atypica]|uniref:kelch repeat-containing protein n=1 Tax=Thalassotalea atypica TaxID=2054316 RepID=UPI002573920C|nr:kelch repeat-containing protein [Thalassotalea atypica]